MCCTAILLLIGALVVFAVENETTTKITSTENTTAPVSVFIHNTTLFKEKEYLNNFTTPSFTVTLPNTTTISDGESELSTPPPSEPPQTNNYTTDDSLKTVSQSSTNNMIKSTAKSIATTTKATEAVKNGPKVLSGLKSQQEDAQIPLSTVDAEVFDTTSVKDMQTFTPAESTEPLQDPAPLKEAEKPEGWKESADVKQENQQNLSSTHAKMEGLTVVDLTDGEPTISNKTSMESLDNVLNENNSNNTRVEVKGNGHDFTEIYIDSLLLK